MNSKSTDEILEVLLRESAAILSVDRGAFSADTPLSALGFDSMRFVELLVAIEIHLKVKLIENHSTGRPENSSNLGSLHKSGGLQSMK